MLRYALLILVVAAEDCRPPADCSAYCRYIYEGKKNFYNTTDATCYPPAKCTLPLVLDTSSNSCSQTTAPTPNATFSPSSANETVISDPDIQCVHGQLISKDICKCDDGFTTQSSNSTGAVEMCNVNEADLPGDDTYVTHSDGSLTLKAQEDNDDAQGDLPFLYKVAILVGEAVLLCIAVKVATVYIRKHYQRTFSSDH
jgi:hypothetical protein